MIAELLEALRGIGEQAVREAQLRRPSSKPVWSLRENLTIAARALSPRLGWRHESVFVHRSAWERELAVHVVIADCGHDHSFRLDELRLLKNRDIVDALFDREGERSCYCVPRSER